MEQCCPKLVVLKWLGFSATISVRVGAKDRNGINFFFFSGIMEPQVERKKMVAEVQEVITASQVQIIRCKRQAILSCP